MPTFIAKKTEILRQIDPDYIYVENIRAFFNLPFKVAKFLCEMAVKDRFFTKSYGVRCPQCGRIIISVENKDDIPETVECEICEDLEEPKFEFSRDELKILEYYSLIRNGNR